MKQARAAGRGARVLVFVIGEGRRTDAGHVAALVGYFTDLTDAVKRTANAQATVSIQAAAKSRAAIEQAKALAGWAYGLDAEEAFASPGVQPHQPAPAGDRAQHRDPRAGPAGDPSSASDLADILRSFGVE